MIGPRFKAWDTDKKKMWSAKEMGEDGLTLSPDGRGFVNISGTSTKLNQYLEHLIPLQYSEVHDSTGKDICVGDVFEDGSQCAFAGGRFFKMWKEEACEDIGEGMDTVVGTVFENPELVEG